MLCDCEFGNSKFEGDLRLGGEFRARFSASGWEGTGRVDVCEPLRQPCDAEARWEELRPSYETLASGLA